MPEIGLALAYAAEQVAGQEGANADYQRTYARARIVRDIGMSSVETLVKSGDIAEAERKKLLEGGSPLQLARELDGLARFYVARSGTAQEVREGEEGRRGDEGNAHARGRRWSARRAPGADGLTCHDGMKFASVRSSVKCALTIPELLRRRRSALGLPISP